ncbi:hypothetical protein ACP70R_020561 [Stipagrostis hirtigluma subsp. patula]
MNQLLLPNSSSASIRFRTGGPNGQKPERMRLADYLLLLLVCLPLPIVTSIISTCFRRLLEQHESPQIQVEILASAVLLLQYLQIVFWLERCRRNHWLVQCGAWAAYYVPLPLSAYAVGVMLRCQCPYWLVAIFFAAGQMDTMDAYNLDGHKQSTRRFAKQTLSLAYLIVALMQGDEAKRPAVIVSIMLGFPVFYQDLKINTWAMIPSSDLCMVAADHVRSKPGEFVVAVGSLESYQSAVSGCTTYSDILRLKYPTQSNDICLSSALFLQLLQHCDNPQPQVIGPPGVIVLFKNLLAEARDYARAFNLVEVQLSFLYDYFFTAPVSSPSITYYQLYALHIILKMAFLYSVLCTTDLTINEVVSSGSILFLLLLLLCQISYQASSNQSVLSKMCHRARDQKHGRRTSPRLGPIALFPKLGPIAVGRKHNWQSKLGQYSLVEDFDSTSLIQRLMEKLLGRPRRGIHASPVALRDEVKRWIMEKSVDSKPGAFTFAAPSQMQKGVFAELSWTFSEETEIHTILIWHVATWFCARTEAGKVQLCWSEYTVATELSCYCAYLVAFYPELLPGHHTVTRTILDEAVEEVEHDLKGETSRDMRYRKMATCDLDESPDQGIFKSGIKLGRQLMEMTDGTSKRWEIIADFWAEMLLFVAQSGNATAHIEHLAKGGEFVTHIWALLSNAGIQRDSPFIKEANNGGNRSTHPYEHKGKGPAN